MTADEFLAMGLQALRNDFENGVNGGDVRAKLSLREFHLACALDRIASGEIGPRKARDYAKNVLRIWFDDVDVSSAAS
jgi:hypothetical protein